MLTRLTTALLCLALAATGCAGYLDRLPPPGASGDASQPANGLDRLDPEVMSRFLRAQVLLAQPAPTEGPDTRAEDAVELLKEALALVPDAPPVWRALATARARGGDYAAAAGAARQAVALDPENPRARYQLGELLHRLGELGEAEEHLRLAAARGIGGDDPHLPHYYLYYVIKEQDRPDDALAALDGWMKALPEDPYPATLRAQLLREHGRVAEARAAALAALLQNPGSEDALGVYLDSFRVDHGAESRWTSNDAIGLQEAVGGLESVLVTDWSRPHLHRVVMSLYERIGRYDKAEEHLRFVRILGRQRASWLAQKEVDLLIRQHRHRDAQALIDELLAESALVEGDRVRLQLFRVTSLERSGDIDGALRALNDIEPKSDDYGMAAVKRAGLLLSEGELAAAASAAISARGHISPRDTSRHSQLLDVAARARLALGDLEGARGIIDELEQLNPGTGMQRRVEYDIARGELQRAVNRVRERLAREPGDAGLATLLAETFVAAGDSDAARGAFDDAERQVARWEEARLEGATGAKAVEVRAQAERQRVFLWTARAQLLQSIGDHDGAAVTLKRILVLRPDDADTLNFLGYVYAVADRELDEAAELVSVALEQRAFSAAVVDSMGWIRFRQGRLEEADELLQRAADWKPGDPEILDHLAHIHAALGRTAQAKRTWQVALGHIAPHEASRSRLTEAIQASLRSLEAQTAN